MKNMFENSEVFDAYATIDYGYFMINQINNNQKKRTGIEAAIDKATGYDKHLERQLAKELIPILEDIVAAKKVIEADYSQDEQMLIASKNIIK